MAKKKAEIKADYLAEVRKLKNEGPQRLYILRGEEDYLREQFLNELKKKCLPDGDDGFSYKRFDGPELNAAELEAAIDALPFLGERTFVELREIDINRLENGERYLKALTDIPDYCTAAVILPPGYELDKRLKLTKGLINKGCDLNFGRQSDSMLFNWITRRFAAAGKNIEFEAVQRLMFVSGCLMNQLIPEIGKVASYAKGDCVTSADVDAVAHHIPEANVFEMIGHLAKREYNVAAGMLAELISGSEDNEPIFIMALFGTQFRRLYAAKLADEEGLGIKYVADTCSMYENYARELLYQSRGFSPAQLKRAVRLCAEADYKMKSSGIDDTELLKETFTRIALGETDA